ncbi:MAG TPA: hypothetical protein VF723_13820 [Pyrinomonadaceae bacterium]|jgi:hypothetical protein
MPKDKNLAKHKSRYEVRGGVVNEFEYALNQEALAEANPQPFPQPEDESAEQPPQSEAERIHRMMDEAREEAEHRLGRPNHPTVSGATRQPGAQKAGARKAAANSSQKGGRKAAKAVPAAAGAGSKKGAAGGAKKGAAGKAAGKKGAAKGAARTAAKRAR